MYQMSDFKIRTDEQLESMTLEEISNYWNDFDYAVYKHKEKLEIEYKEKVEYRMSLKSDIRDKD